MKRFLSYAAIFSATLYASTAALLYGAEAGVEQPSFTPDTVRPGGVASYSLVIKNMSPELNLRDIPVPQGLRYVGQSQSSSFSMSTGSGISRSVNLSLSFVAEKEGSLSIPEWKFTHDGKTYTVAAATLKVDANAPASSVSRGSGMAASFPSMGMNRFRQPASVRSSNSEAERNFSLDGKYRLEIELPRTAIYVGESAPCTLVFSVDRELYSKGYKLSQIAPRAEKADEFECAGFAPEKPEIDTSDPNRIYIKYKFFITPIKTGTYPIDFKVSGIFLKEASVEDMMDMSLFDRMMSMGAEQFPFELSAQEKSVEVKPLPENGKPENFSGAIGNFKIDSASISPDSLSVDEPCTLTVKISGEGNFQRISQPALASSQNWRVYKFKSSFFDESNGAAYKGIKTFEAPLLPLKADLTAIPQVEFSFFNPIEEKYETLKAKEIGVSVAPALSQKRKAEVNAPSASPIVAEKTLNGIVETPAGTSRPDFLSSGWFWVLQSAILAALVAFIYSRRKKIRLETDPLYARMQKSKREVRSELKCAEKYAASRDAKKFFTHARAAIQWALYPKTDADSAAILLGEAKRILKQAGLSDIAIQASEYFDGADAVEYGALDTSSLDYTKLLSTLRSICERIKNEN